MPLLRHLLRHHPRLLSTSSTATTTPPSPTLISSLQSSLSQFSTPSADPTSFRSHFLLHYSDVNFTTPLLSSLLSSPSPSPLLRSPLLLLSHLISDRSFTPSDHSLSLLIRHLSSRHDFSPIPSLLQTHPSAAGPTSFAALSSSYIRSSRPNDACSLFLSLPSPLFPSLSKSKSLLLPLLTSLADHKFPSHAERLVKACACDVFPDDEIRTELLRAYTNSLKLDHAFRLSREILRGGFGLSTTAYNHLLDCVCRVARKRDPVRMKPEADKFLLDLDANVPRDSETFRVLIYNLCKIRRTNDALALFHKMGEWNCSPCAETYLVLVRSLYQAARVTEGDEMVGWMRAAGFGDRLDRKAYYGFVKILCGIERVDHAMKVFRMMKGYGFAPGVKSYDLLIGKLAEHNQVDRAKALFKEARARGVDVKEREYKVDPRFAKKKEKKRETLPEKMKKKRRRLKRLRLSYVKKPKKQRRLA